MALIVDLMMTVSRYLFLLGITIKYDNANNMAYCLMTEIVKSNYI